MKTRKDWFDGISELVHASDCIALNNISSGKTLYDIDDFFDGWKREYIKKRMVELYGDKANINKPISNE